jgi:hypothetical protein
MQWHISTFEKFTKRLVLHGRTDGDTLLVVQLVEALSYKPEDCVFDS